MRMQVQVLTPRVQYRQEAEVGSQVLRVSRQVQHRLRCCLKEQLVDNAGILQTNRSEIIRQGKHHVKIFAMCSST